MDQERLSREEIVEYYRDEVKKLTPYIAWLESKVDQSVKGIYEGEGIKEHSLAVPVYDAMLLRFAREAGNLKLVDKNYVYIYSKYGMKTAADEHRAIKRAALQDMNLLGGILSKYIIRGQVQGKYWAEGVENQIFLRVILKMKELIEFWDKPSA